jgi:hypothetical protein
MSMSRQAYERQVKSMHYDLVVAINEIGGVECADLPDVFYPNEIRDEISRFIAQKTALSICNRCSLIKMCKEYAIYGNELYGIWGGLTEEERKTRD